MKAVERYRGKLIEFLSDIENELSARCKYPEILGISRTTLYKHFPPAELSKIENEALEIRRTRCARHLMAVDAALFERAKTGDPAACKLVYMRFEGWSEKRCHEFIRGPLIPSKTHDEIAEETFKALRAAYEEAKSAST